MSRPGIESMNYETVALDDTIYHDSHHLFQMITYRILLWLFAIADNLKIIAKM
jgi:hypothetical protein